MKICIFSALHFTSNADQFDVKFVSKLTLCLKGIYPKVKLLFQNMSLEKQFCFCWNEMARSVDLKKRGPSKVLMSYMYFCLFSSSHTGHVLHFLSTESQLNSFSAEGVSTLWESLMMLVIFWNSAVLPELKNALFISWIPQYGFEALPSIFSAAQLKYKLIKSVDGWRTSSTNTSAAAPATGWRFQELWYDWYLITSGRNFI